MPIDIQGLTYTYLVGSPFEEGALRGVDLHVDDGEFVAIIGHTGCGKSTLIQHINGLLKPTEGKVVVNGVDTGEKGADLKTLRRQVGLVFQYPEHQLFEETVNRDVAFGPKNMDLPEDEVERRVARAMALVGVDREAIGEKSPFEISGGQRRRVAIAGVLAMDPSILILDEPSAGLDPSGRREMLRLVSDIHKTRGCTVLYVTHNMDEAARVAQRILVMERGQIIMDGPPEDIFSRGSELMATGLDVPDIVKLAQALRDCGVPVPGAVMTPEALRAFLKTFREGRDV